MEYIQQYIQHNIYIQDEHSQFDNSVVSSKVRTTQSTRTVSLTLVGLLPAGRLCRPLPLLLLRFLATCRSGGSDGHVAVTRDGGTGVTKPEGLHKLAVVTVPLVLGQLGPDVDGYEKRLEGPLQFKVPLTRQRPTQVLVLGLDNTVEFEDQVCQLLCFPLHTVLEYGVQTLAVVVGPHH